MPILGVRPVCDIGAYRPDVRTVPISVLVPFARLVPFGVRPGMRSVPSISYFSPRSTLVNLWGSSIPLFHTALPTAVISTAPNSVVFPSAFIPLVRSVCPNSCFSPHLPVLAYRGLLSHHSVRSFPNQDPRVGSICSETLGLEGRKAIVNTLRCTSRDIQRKYVRKERFRLDERGRRWENSKGYPGVRDSRSHTTVWVY